MVRTAVRGYRKLRRRETTCHGGDSVYDSGYNISYTEGGDEGDLNETSE